MKIVNIIGGLGNQMFQYAFALYLKNKYVKEEILIDIHHFKHYKLHNGFELSRIFKNLNIDVANKKQLQEITYYIPHYYLFRCVRRLFPRLKTEYIEKAEYKYDNAVSKIEGNCYYEGYWQSCKYYLDIKSDIIDVFTFPNPDEYNKQLVLNIESSNSVGIHVRRGDYINHKDFKGICDIDYYKRAIGKLFERSDKYFFYIFSNDIEWCKSNLELLLGNNQVTYVTGNIGKNSFWDMFLMSKCKHLIIANSSFSWWGAFLNINIYNIYAPKKWNNRYKVNEICCPEWTQV